MKTLFFLVCLYCWLTEKTHISPHHGREVKIVDCCVVCLNENALVFSSLSSCGLHFSGRTQKQVLDYVKEGGHKKVQFER